jgi:hypothetical protein
MLSNCNFDGGGGGGCINDILPFMHALAIEYIIFEVKDFRAVMLHHG